MQLNMWHGVLTGAGTFCMPAAVGAECPACALLALCLVVLELPRLSLLTSVVCLELVPRLLGEHPMGDVGTHCSNTQQHNHIA
jgi:hypothetical protein